MKKNSLPLFDVAESVNMWSQSSWPHSFSNSFCPIGFQACAVAIQLIRKCITLTEKSQLHQSVS